MYKKYGTTFLILSALKNINLVTQSFKRLTFIPTDLCKQMF
jgi:hypothetical protein